MRLLTSNVAHLPRYQVVVGSDVARMAGGGGVLPFYPLRA